MSGGQNYFVLAFRIDSCVSTGVVSRAVRIMALRAADAMAQLYDSLLEMPLPWLLGGLAVLGLVVSSLVRLFLWCLRGRGTDGV